MSATDSGDPDVIAAETELADELRRIVNRLVLTRPSRVELVAAAQEAREFADLLDSLPPREGSVLSEAGLSPMNHLRHSPWSGSGNVIAPPLNMWAVDGDSDGPDGRHTAGTVTFDTAYEGPPGHVHGGCLAGVFDELLGHSQLRSGFTGQLTIHHRRPVPLRQTVELAAWVSRTDGRKRWVKGTASVDGELLVEAEGLFIQPRNGDGLEAMTESLHRVSQR